MTGFYWNTHIWDLLVITHMLTFELLHIAYETFRDDISTSASENKLIFGTCLWRWSYLSETAFNWWCYTVLCKCNLAAWRNVLTIFCECMHPSVNTVGCILLTLLGKLFKSNDLPFIVEFILMFYRDKPVDWLLDHLLYVKVCNPEKDTVCTRVLLVIFFLISSFTKTFYFYILYSDTRMYLAEVNEGCMYAVQHNQLVNRHRYIFSLFTSASCLIRADWLV